MNALQGPRCTAAAAPTWLVLAANTMATPGKNAAASLDHSAKEKGVRPEAQPCVHRCGSGCCTPHHCGHARSLRGLTGNTDGRPGPLPSAPPPWPCWPRSRWGTMG
eukprot:366546-Chlamydomonas_euryale.AAC.37